MIAYERQKDGTLKQVDSPPKRAELVEQRIYDRCIIRVGQLEAEKATLEARIDELCAENEKLRSCLSDDTYNAREIMAENATLGGDGKSRWYELFGTPERAARTVMRYLYDGCDGVECADGCPFYDVRYLTNCFLTSNTSAHELRVWLEGDA